MSSYIIISTEMRPELLSELHREESVRDLPSKSIFGGFYYLFISLYNIEG